MHSTKSHYLPLHNKQKESISCNCMPSNGYMRMPRKTWRICKICQRPIAVSSHRLLIMFSQIWAICSSRMAAVASNSHIITILASRGATASNSFTIMRRAPVKIMSRITLGNRSRSPSHSRSSSNNSSIRRNIAWGLCLRSSRLALTRVNIHFTRTVRDHIMAIWPMRQTWLICRRCSSNRFVLGRRDLTLCLRPVGK